MSKTDIVKRSDGKYNIYRYMVDPTIDIEEYNEINIPMPERWILVGVEDTFSDADKVVHQY